jgi:carbon monoxide dehydrogenase subunit G
MTVTAKYEPIAATAEQIYALVSNCNHFGAFIPEQVKGWESTEDSCRFTIEGMATMDIRIVEKIACSKVKFQVSNDKHIPMELEIDVENQGDTRKIEISMMADVPIFLQPMVKKPMQNLVDMMATRIGTMNYEIMD